MCGGGGGGNDSVDYQREQEQQRQQRISQGKQQLERIFAGLEGYGYETRTAPQQMEATPDALQAAGWQQVKSPTVKNNKSRAQYYRDSGSTLRGYRNSTGGDTRYWRDANGNRVGANDLPDTITRNVTSDHRVKQGAPIWEQQQEAYIDYAQPQLEQQFGDAQEELTYALSRQGQSQGSLSGERRADLNRDYDLRRQEVADKGRGVANQARSDIASQKQNLLQMLNASADPGGTATAARSAVSSLQSTPEFSPLGPLFQNTTAGLAQGMQGYNNQKMNEKVQGIQYGGDPDRGSGRVIR